MKTDLEFEEITLPHVPRDDDEPAEISQTSFTERTLSGLRKAFLVYGHEPSPRMWMAIKDIADTIGEMAEGKLNPTFYVSSLDPGVGKTQTIVHAIRQLPKEIGVLLCVSRLAEIKSLVADMGLQDSEIGVYTSDNATNELGCKDPTAARVLFTTQQMVDRRLKDGKQFSHLDAFFYKGQPRTVRIWDEAMLPGEELTLNVDSLLCLPKALRRYNHQLAERLTDLGVEIRKAASGESYEVFNIEDEFGLNVGAIKPTLDNMSLKDRESFEMLWRLSGKVVTVRRDHRGNTILDYRDHLPDDFAPVLILDASARVRTTYKFWAESRGNLVQLARANKRYDNLTINLWNKGGGKHSLRTDPNSFMDGVAAAINSKSEEEWLVVHHKPESKIPDFSTAVRDLVSGDKDRVKFLTWGNHHATNEYVGIKNIILAGTLFYPASTYEVRARASKALPAGEELDESDYDEIEAGEHAHLILQALCRGAVRKCEGNTCAPCDAYLIAARNTGIHDVLPDIFPGCKIRSWQPVAKPLNGKVKQAILVLREHFAGVSPTSGKTYSMAAHRKAVGIEDLSNYSRTIRKNDEFKRALAELGIEEVALGRYVNAYALRPF